MEQKILSRKGIKVFVFVLIVYATVCSLALLYFTSDASVRNDVDNTIENACETRGEFRVGLWMLYCDPYKEDTWSFNSSDSGLFTDSSKNV